MTIPNAADAVTILRDIPRYWPATDGTMMKAHAPLTGQYVLLIDAQDAINAAIEGSTAAIQAAGEPDKHMLNAIRFAANDGLERALVFFKTKGLNDFDTDKICERFLAIKNAVDSLAPAPNEADECSICPKPTPYGPATCYECTERELADLSESSCLLTNAEIADPEFVRAYIEACMGSYSDLLHEYQKLRSQPAPAAPTKLHPMGEEPIAQWYFDDDGTNRYIDVKKEGGKFSIYFRDRLTDSEAWLDQADDAAPVAQESGELAKNGGAE